MLIGLIRKKATKIMIGTSQADVNKDEWPSLSQRLELSKSYSNQLEWLIKF